MQTWRLATRTAEVKTLAAGVKDLEPPLGPDHSLPVNSKPLGCFVTFLSSTFFSQNRQQKQTDTPITRSLPDTK